MVKIVLFIRTDFDDTLFWSGRTHSTTWNRSEIKYLWIFNRSNNFSFYLFSVFEIYFRVVNLLLGSPGREVRVENPGLGISDRDHLSTRIWQRFWSEFQSGFWSRVCQKLALASILSWSPSCSLNLRNAIHFAWIEILNENISYKNSIKILQMFLESRKEIILCRFRQISQKI